MCNVGSSNSSISNVNDGNPVVSYQSCIVRHDTNFSIINSFDSGVSLYFQSCNVQIDTLQNDQSGSLTFENTVATIQNYYIINNTTIKTNIINRSQLNLVNYSADGSNPETSDSNWNLTNSRLIISSWLHDGRITNPLVIVDDDSYFFLESGAIVNTQNILFDIRDFSSFDIENLDCTDCSRLVLVTDNCLYGRLFRVNDNGVNNNPLGSYIKVTGGELSIERCVFTASIPFSCIELNEVKAIITDLRIEQKSDFSVMANNCTIRIDNSSINDLSSSAITFTICNFAMNNVSITAANDGVRLYRCSKGYLNTISGSAGKYGVDLQSGSSFSDSGTNTITGAANDVNTGNAGGSSWGGLTTTDFFTIPSQYVTITPF